MGEETLTVLKIPIRVIGARLYARIQAHRKRGANSFGVDDVLIVLAWVSYSSPTLPKAC